MLFFITLIKTTRSSKYQYRNTYSPVQIAVVIMIITSNVYLSGVKLTLRTRYMSKRLGDCLRTCCKHYKM